MSDHSPLSLELVLHAAAAFQPGRKIHTCEIDLRDRQQQLPPHDYLVAADLMYDDDVAFALGRHVRAQRERGATAILADPGRKGGRFRAAFARGLGEDVHFVEQRLPKRWRADVPSCGVSVLRPAAAASAGCRAARCSRGRRRTAENAPAPSFDVRTRYFSANSR